MTISEAWDPRLHPRDRLGRWRDVIGALRGLGINAHLVGGSVRDEMLGREPKDHDFLAAGHSHESIRAAVQPHGHVEDLVVAGRKVGVRLYPHGENLTIEITPPRKEVSTGPGHQDFDIVADPSVTVEEDLARRDFTVNAMAKNLDTGKIIDPYGGRKDLRKGVLRTVTPESFRDDPLRIVRGLRFVSTLGLTPDDETLKQMRQYAGGIDHISGERVMEQMDKLLMGDHPAKALRIARDTGVLRHIYPELASMVGFGQESKYHGLSADEHTFEVVQSLADAGAPLHVRLAGLFHDSGKPEAAFRGTDGNLHYYGNPETGHSPHEQIGAGKWLATARRHHYDSDTRAKVRDLVAEHMWTTYDKPTDVKARRFLRQHGHERGLDLIALKRADISGKESGADERVLNSHRKLDDFEARVNGALAAGYAYHRSMLHINGSDLIALGFTPGPQLGEVLDRLLSMVIGQPELNNREWLLRQAASMLRKMGGGAPPAKRDPGTRSFAENLRLPKSGKSREHADRIVAALDSLLALPPMPPVDVKGYSANSKLGRYRRRKDEDGTFEPDSIGFSLSEKPHLTLAHEIAHYIDNEGFRAAGGTSSFESRRASINSMSPEDRADVLSRVEGHDWLRDDAPSYLDEWLRVVQGSDAVAKLSNDVPFWQVQTHKYLLRPPELFARSFAQWLAVRSGDPEMLRELHIVQGKGGKPPVAKLVADVVPGDVFFERDKPEPFVVKEIGEDRHGYRVFRNARGKKISAYELGGWAGDRHVEVFASADDARVVWYMKHPRQWEDDDFEAVAAALDRAFEQAGMLKRRERMAA